MKKFMMIAALAAMIIPFASCGKRDVNNPSQGPKATIARAENAGNAKKVEISDEKTDIKSIEFTDGGRYIITMEVTKATEIVYITGTYTVSGNTYTLDGFGTVTVSEDGSSVEINGSTGEGDTIAVTVSCTTTEAPADVDEFTRDICHAWRVDKVDISINMNGTSVGVIDDKDPSNIPALAEKLIKQAKEQGFDLDMNLEPIKGMQIVYIDFSSQKTLTIKFKDHADYVGTISNVNGYDFHYDLEGNVGSSIINGSADCNFHPDTDKTATLKISATVNDYKGRVIFNLTKID